MHQKQPPPKSASSVLFVVLFIELVGWATAVKFSARSPAKSRVIVSQAFNHSRQLHSKL